jgi:hypothetical protein
MKDSPFLKNTFNRKEKKWTPRAVYDPKYIRKSELEHQMHRAELSLEKLTVAQVLKKKNQRTHASTRQWQQFHTMLILLGEELCVLFSPTGLLLEDHSWSAVHNCLFYTFTATLNIWTPHTYSVNSKQQLQSNLLVILNG